jgi:hypothetical protein
VSIFLDKKGGSGNGDLGIAGHGACYCKCLYSLRCFAFANNCQGDVRNHFAVKPANHSSHWTVAKALVIFTPRRATSTSRANLMTTTAT